MDVMTSEEYLSVSAAILLLAIYHATCARWHVTEIPWFQLYRNPSLFGGSNALVRNILCFFVWCSFSVSFGLLVAYVAALNEPTADYIYRFLGYRHKADAGIFTLVLAAICFYTIVVKRVKRLLRKHDPVAVAESVGGARDIFDDTKVRFRDYWGLNYGAYRWLKLFVDWFPLLLGGFYKPFYYAYVPLTTGCASLLVYKYGPDTIRNFCDDHIKQNGPLMSGMDPVQFETKLSQFEKGSTNHARAIALAKIAEHGYAPVRDELDKYVERARHDEPQESPRQKERLFLKARRIFQQGCMKVVCHHRELSIKGHLIECSKDGSGCYVALKERLSANDSVRIKLPNIEPLILGKLRHSEGRYWNKKTISGHGVYVTDENSRNVLATFMAARS